MKVLHGLLLALVCTLSGTFSGALAQTSPPPPAAPAGTIDEIVVQGANGATISETLVGLVKVSITVSVGDPVADVKPDELRTQILETGFFSEAKVEVVTREGRNVLVITVTENPVVGEVKIQGNTLFPTATFLQFLDRNFNLAPGVVVNNAKIEQARQALGQAYRQALPFTPEVKVEVSAPANGKVTVTYTINESAELKTVTVTGATLVPTAEIEALFKPLTTSGKFDARGYIQAAQAAQALYTAKGYRGSGPNPEKSELVDGKLTVVITEFKIAAIDATALSVDPSQLTAKVGDFFNYSALLKEAQALAKGRDKQVTIKVEQVSDDSVVVTFTLEDAPAGPINEIRIEGNTAVPTARLVAALQQKVGDTYNAQVAQEVDFPAIAEIYQTAGFALVTPGRLTYADGVYTITLTELKLVGYEVAWRGAHRTQDRVITRELPPVGGLLDFNKIRSSFRRIQELGILKDARIDIKQPDANKPEEVILVLDLEEGPSGNFLPGIEFNTLTGFAGNLQYTENNAWGLGHRISGAFQAQPNDAGQVVSGGVSYTIPWLDVDFLDFRRTRTEFSFYVSSNVASGLIIPNQPLGVNNPLTPDVDESSNDFQRKYSTRNTGFGISLARPLLENLTLRFSFNFQYEQNYLERRDNTLYPTGDVAAQALLPLDSATAFTQVSAQFSTKNRIDFPTAGIVVDGSVGYGFGSEGVNTPTPAGLSWTQAQLGFKTYLGLGWDSNGEIGIGGEDRNFALAFRFNTGVILGDAPTNALFRIGGAGGADAFTLRGFDFQDLRGEVYYTGSLELRYDFGLRTSFTYGLLGIAWVDFGNAWGGDQQFRRTNSAGQPIGEGIQFGYGLGVQINLGFGQLQLPAIRLDYGWSAFNPGGRFYFRLGFPF
jgi:outer membrane protein insertion porin family